MLDLKQTRHTDRPRRFKALQKSRFLWDVGRKRKDSVLVQLLQNRLIL